VVLVQRNLERETVHFVEALMDAAKMGHKLGKYYALD
jgi:hypothetical protein